MSEEKKEKRSAIEQCQDEWGTLCLKMGQLYYTLQMQTRDLAELVEEGKKVNNKYSYLKSQKQAEPKQEENKDGTGNNEDHHKDDSGNSNNELPSEQSVPS